METQDLLDSAILKIKHKYIPISSDPQSTINPEPHLSLYKLLQVFDIPDDETVDKIKFIYNHFLEHGGNPQDQIVSLQTELGAVKYDETWVGKIWKYCKLKNEANQTMQRYENIERDIKSLASPKVGE